MAFDVALGGEFFASFGFDGVMDVRGAAGIRNGLDGAEKVFAAAAGEEPAEALEMFVAFFLVASARVEVGAGAVALPDLDESIADRLSAFVENPAGNPGDFADCGSEAVIDDEEVVIGIEGKFVGIERAFGLGRSASEFFGEEAGGGGERGEESGVAQE